MSFYFGIIRHSHDRLRPIGTTVYYKPGVLTGGRIEHDCGLERGIGYFLEVILCLAPFCKKALKATFLGITNHSDNLDASADLFRTVFLPNMRHFGLTEGLTLKIVRRGMPPQGGGVVSFECPIIKTLSPVQLLDDGEVKRIRGIAYTARLSPDIGNRMIETTKAALTKYTGDVYIYGDHYKGKESGNSSGFGLTIVAETTNGCLMSSELIAKPQQLPEDVRYPQKQMHFVKSFSGFISDVLSLLGLLFSWRTNAVIIC